MFQIAIADKMSANLVSFPRCDCRTGTQNRARNHQFFVCVNNAHFDTSGVRENHRRVFFISCLVQFNAKKVQPFANALADWWCIFTDASGENERVQARSEEHTSELQSRQYLV